MVSKIRLPLFLVSLSLVAFFALTSCSQPVSAVDYEYLSTLQNLSAQRQSLLQWTGELETPPAKTPYSEMGIDKSIRATVQNIIASGTSVEPQYPSLAGFTSLDTSQLEKSQIQLLQRFCETFSRPSNTWVSAAPLMQQGQAYALVVFAYDFEQFASGKGLVDTYYLGKPFVSDQITQCPVRLVLSDAEKTPANICVWLSQADGRWGISHITWMEESD
ncbi:MAG TPA: hypothetical protein DCQ43_01190 [Treponema sp.]|nr:hypothetical protein [Treponema sp.]